MLVIMDSCMHMKTCIFTDLCRDAFNTCGLSHVSAHLHSHFTAVDCLDQFSYRFSSAQCMFVITPFAVSIDTLSYKFSSFSALFTYLYSTSFTALKEKEILSIYVTKYNFQLLDMNIKHECTLSIAGKK